MQRHRVVTEHCLCGPSSSSDSIRVGSWTAQEDVGRVELGVPAGVEAVHQAWPAGTADELL